MTTLNPYISFTGNAREAMEFYRTVFGGHLTIDTFGASGMGEDPATADQVMHAMLVTDEGLTLMASDTPPGMEVTVGDNVQISLSGPAEDEIELRGYWERLSTSGTADLPLTQAPWGDHFGMCTDAYGIRWMVNIGGDEAA
ncbi:VOC family protein [Ornithinimicrobium sp. W1665]|uniref:VOC family protein n=1 Tax=Ornithinimicrobium sp. W1665 TaxID=3416666 RepID=UPI003CEFF624